jgi:YXWGXW repeat-containing protein
MRRPLRLLLCASAAALILGAAPVGGFTAPAQAQVAIGVSASIAPPLLPIYSQPPIPGPGYVWIPGAWAFDGAEFYWVPGYWALPPAADLLWTPGYWAWNDADDDYVFDAGYWGPTVGFYGGVDYGFGYPGAGYYGGYWRDHQFYYNRAVNNLGAARITTAFNRPVPAAPENRVSFNGGKGGTTVRPTPAELAMAREHHIAPTAAQVEHQQAASKMADLRFNANHGRPPIAAMQRPNEFHGAHVAAATAAAAAGAADATHAAALHHPAVRPPTGHPQVAHRAPVTHAPRRFAAHAPAMRAPAYHPRFAYHAPAMRTPAYRPRFAYHAPMMRAPAFHPNFAFHAPAMRMGSMGGMHFGGAPHFGGMRMGGGPHFAGAPHMGGGGHRAP